MVYLAIPAGAHAALNETPSRDSGLILQPFQNQPGFGNDAAFADSALSNQGYSLERLVDGTLNALATSRVSDFTEALQAGQGAVVLSTHGGPERFVVEVYDAASLNTMLARWQTYAASGFDTTSHIYWTLQYPPGQPAYCGIGLTSAGVTHYFESAKTIVYAAACYSLSLTSAWDGARCLLGYPGLCTGDAANEDFERFWERLDGQEGKAARTVTAAWNPTSLTLYGNGATVLSPAVLTLAPAPAAVVPCDFDGFVRFDAAMDTAEDPDRAVVGVTQVRLDNVRWSGDDTIEFTAHPLEYTTIRFRLDASSIRSANNGGIRLDGNLDPPGSDGRGPSGDDFEWTAAGQCDDPFPEAWVDDVEWRDGGVAWTSLLERGSQAYRLSGSDRLVGAEWSPASKEVPAEGSGARYFVRPTSQHPYYRVEEREAGLGGDRWLAYAPVEANVVERSPKRPPRERGPKPVTVLAPAHLAEAAEQYRLARAAMGFATTVQVSERNGVEAIAELDGAVSEEPRAERVLVWGGSNVPGPQTNVAPDQNDLAIVFPLALNATGAITAYAIDKQALGWNVALVPKGSESFAQVKARVDSLEAAGADAILFFGTVREGNGPGTTMPATVEPDSNSNFYDFSIGSDTLLTLWDYEKGMGVPERIGPWVGYVPVESASEAWDYADKMSDYEWNGPFRSNWDNYASWGWDVGYGGNSPAQIVADVQAATALVPSSWEKEEIWGSQVPQGLGWSDMAAGSLNAGQGVVLALSNASAPDNPAHWLNGGSGYFDPWSDLVPNFKCPLLLSLSCSSAMIDAVHVDDLPVVVHDLLVVPDRGIIGAIGPTRGFYEPYYALYAKRFWEMCDTGRYFFVGSIHRAVRNSLLDDFPSDPLIALFCRMLILAGDPTTTLPGVNLAAITAVDAGSIESHDTQAAWLAAPQPNPFNPSVRVAFGLPRAGRVRLRVLDTSGRVVATLLDGLEERGEHIATWNGHSESGARVGSGVYFFEMRAASERRVQRAVLIR
jgi:hypothetical protein